MSLFGLVCFALRSSEFFHCSIASLIRALLELFFPLRFCDTIFTSPDTHFFMHTFSGRTLFGGGMLGVVSSFDRLAPFVT
jgi:hypothetical protein